MAPEYGSSTGYFPVDDATLTYLRETGRSEEQVALVRDATRAAGLWFDHEAAPVYAETVAIDLGAIPLSLAGPRRPQDLRSEEHTSELQSLMRNSYAVLCLKKKKQNKDMQPYPKPQ